MKRILSLCTAFLILYAMCACGQSDIPVHSALTQSVQEAAPSKEEPTPSAVPEEPEAQPEQTQSDILVAYFSATGNTARIAAYLQTVLDADLWEILPEETYTDADLDYGTDDCRANREQNDPEARPAITGIPDHPSDYAAVFLGYPIWWGQAPKVIYTFLEQCDLGDAVLIPFCTSGSSGIGSSAEALHTLAPDAHWLSGQRFGPTASQEDVAAWVEGLDLTQTAGEQIQLLLTFDGGEAIIALEDNATTRDFLTALPDSLSFADYAGTEKISYLDRTLSTEGAPDTYDPEIGDVTLYAPWGNLAIFYGDAGSAPGLVPMGKVTSGLEVLAAMEGEFEASVSIR